MKKIVVDCNKCDGAACCTFSTPLGFDVQCTSWDGGCTRENKDKPLPCRLYPIVLISSVHGIFVCVDTNCPEHESINPEDVAAFINELVESEDELPIFDDNSVNFFGWKLKPLARIA